MSLLYKALNQASQQREKGSLKPDTAKRRSATAIPATERLGVHGFPQAAGGGGAARAARWSLFALLGVSAIVIALAFFVPREKPPEVIATPEPVGDQAPAAPDIVVVAPKTVAPPDVQASGTPSEVAVEQTAEAFNEALATEAEALPSLPVSAPARIGTALPPEDIAPRQREISEGGLENYVDEQLKRESLAGLGAPIDLNREAGASNLSPRAPVEITDDTDMVRERYESAASMLERNQPEQALYIYDQLLRNNPRDRLSLLGRAAALQKLGRTEMALAAYEEVLTAFPGDEWALVNLLGLVSTQDPQRALQQLDRLQRRNPSVALVPAQIGMIQMAQGNYEMAARHLDKAVALEPENAKYVFNLAVVYDKWGQTGAALRYYRQCLEMAAQNPDGQIPVETVRSRMAFLDVK